MAEAAEQLSDGQMLESKVKARGFSDDEISQWKGQMSDSLVKRGFSPEEVKSFWGQKDFDHTPITDHVTKNIASMAADQQGEGKVKEKPKREPIDVSPQPIAAKDIWDAMAAGWSHSFAGLMIDREKPPIEMSKDSSVAQAVANQGAMMFGDSPAMAAGMAGGTAIAGPVGGFAGMGAVPEFMRSMLLDKYNKGEADSAGEFAHRVVNATWQAAKAGTASAAMGVAGANLKVINALSGSRLAQLASSLPSQLVAENAAQATVAAALEGHLPDKRDFINGTVAMAGFHALSAGFAGAASVKEKLENAYVKTGLRPDEIGQAVHKDPVMKGEFFSDNPDLPKDAARPERTSELVKSEEVKPPEQKVNSGYELPQDEKAQVLARIGEEPEEPAESMIQKAKDGALDLYVNTFDKTARLKDILEKAGKTDLADSSYLMARVFADVNNKIEGFIQKGTVDPETNDVNGEGLMQILTRHAEESGDKDLSNLKAYMISSRMRELINRSIVQDKDYSKHDSIIAAGKEKYDRVAKEVVAYENRVMNYARGKGLLSEEQVAAMTKAGEYYIPLDKIVEADRITGKAGSAGLYKKIGHSILQIRDPIESIFRKTEIVVRAADANELKAQAAKDLLSSENAADFIQEATADQIKSTKVSGGDVWSALQKQGIDLPKEAIDGFNVFRRITQGDGPGMFSFKENGKLRTVKVDPALADVLNSYSEHPVAMGIFTRAFKTFADAMRFGTIQNPLTGFFVRHTVRNQQQAPLFSKNSLTPVDVIKTLMLSDEDKQLWSQAARDGAFIHSFDRAQPEYYTDQIARMDKKMPFRDYAWNKVENALQFSHAFIMANDNKIRFAEYKKALESGKSRDEATLNARDVLADFQKSGLQRGFIQATTAFFKAHYQGEFQLAGALSDPEQRWGVLAKHVGYITVPSVLLGLAQADDDRVNDLPDWLKYNYWNVHIPHWRKAEENEAMSQMSAYPKEVRKQDDGTYMVNDGVIFRIPKPFANGMAFGSAFEEVLRDYNKHDPAHFGKFLGSIAEKMIANPVPTFFQPVLEQATNRNFFGGKPLVRAEMERNKVSEMQYTPYTSEFAKFLGDKIADVPMLREFGPKDAKLASPQVIENYINAWTGGSGKYILSTIDKLMSKTGVTKDVPKPESTWSDVPFVKEFLIRQNIEPQSVQDFMESQDLQQQVNGSIKAAMKEGDYEKVSKLQARYATSGVKVGTYQKGMISMMSAISKVNADPSMDPVQKRQLIDGLTYQIISAAHQGNEFLDSIKQAMKNTKGR